MQQLQLHLPVQEKDVLDPIVKEQLVELMAETILAAAAWEKETSDDHRAL